MNFQEAMAAWQADQPLFEARGVSIPGVNSYIPDGWKSNWLLAMDAQPQLAGTSANSGVPMMFTTLVDPSVFQVLFAPLEAANILGEERKGTWLDQTAMFPTVEHTGETSSYGDFNENGRANVNTNWPQRQSYLFQIMKEYGDLELERAGLGRINWVSEIDQGAADILARTQNFSYFFGVQGLQNYGLLNDPNLSAALTPGTKAVHTPVWIFGGVVTATANEIYTDVQSLFIQLVNQSAGLVKPTDKLVLAMSPASSVALTTTNQYNVNVYDLLKKNFPNIRFETAMQYGVISASNPEGSAGGNMMQMIAETVGGQKTGYCAFNEKMMSSPIIRAVSSYKQKVTGGTWGAINRQPLGIATMLGI